MVTIATAFVIIELSSSLIITRFQYGLSDVVGGDPCHDNPCKCLLERIYILQCSYKYLDIIPVWAENPNITEVYISQNPLLTIHKNSFSNLANLNKINISFNQIYHIEDHGFQYLPYLQVLLLDHNDLNIVTEQMFSGIPNLTRLDLEFNKISRIGRNAFRHLSQLKILDLSDNHVDYLGENSLTGLKSLQNLYLIRNRLSRIHQDAFQPTTNLNELDMNKNNLTRLHRQVFSPLSNLTVMKIEKNRLIKLDKFAFIGVSNLRSLYLTQNEISIIEHGALSHLKHLSFLDLRGNPLLCDSMQNISRKVFFYLPRCIKGTITPAVMRGLNITIVLVILVLTLICLTLLPGKIVNKMQVYKADQLLTAKKKAIEEHEAEVAMREAEEMGKLDQTTSETSFPMIIHQKTPKQKKRKKRKRSHTARQK